MPKSLPSAFLADWPELRQKVPVGPLTTFGIGGQVAWYLPIYSDQDLIRVIKQSQSVGYPYLLMAGGTNVVFGDDLINKLLIHFGPPTGRLPALKIVGRQIEVPAGLALADLVKAAGRSGLTGLEQLSGIPGSVGGAIVGNAGAYGRTISDCLTKILIYDGRQSRWINQAAGRFKYRHSVFKDKPWLVLAARFELMSGSRTDLLKTSRQIIKKREEKYQPSLACPGSFFKNVLLKDLSSTTGRRIDPTKIIDGKVPAGYLLEAVGACGLRQGNIQVASWHGNLLINTGGGTYRQVRALAGRLKSRVKRRFGVALEEEVRYML